MTRQFRYEELSCLALQQAIKANGAFEVVLAGEQAQAFEHITRSLTTGQQIDQEPIAHFKNQNRLRKVFIRLIRNIPLACKTMFKFHRFGEFRTFWHLEGPLSVSASAQNSDEAIFRVSRLTSHSNGTRPSGRAP